MLATSFQTQFSTFMWHPSISTSSTTSCAADTSTAQGGGLGRIGRDDLAMRATIAAKYTWIAPAMLRAALDGRDSLNRRPISETFGWLAPVIQFLIRCAEESRRLIALVA